jgi:hypothetical protein
MSNQMSAPFSYAEVRPYEVAASLDELQGPDHGALELPHELVWSGRRRYHLDDDYDRAAACETVLEEGREEHFRRAAGQPWPWASAGGGVAWAGLPG